MSSIYKLSICGVRSFDPEGSETIQFGFPLTLICGQNGCGKTTIIECLKYATTGDLPPNSKGGAFVHDPKLAYKSEVRAQVKLAFSNANGKSMICTRSMQLAKKRGRGANGGGDNTTFKTLEGQLAIMNKGERSTISTKNAELDAQVPLYLGASKAVLDYVIFCHQDDSLWPLSEASILKKRFDDIFEALKFTKVLDNLKVIRKDMTTDIKLIEQSVEHFKIDKERANKIKNKLDNMKVVMNTYTEDITDLTRRLEEYEAKADKLFSSNQQFQQVLSKLQQLRMSQKSYQDQILRLKLSVDEILPDSDSELMNQLSNFDTILEGKKSEIGGLNTQLGELEKSLINMRLQHNKAIGLEGSLRAKEEVYRADLIERSRIIDTHKEIVKSNSQGTDGDDEQIAFAFSSGLSSILESSRSTFQLIKDENKSKEKILGDEVKKVENSIVTFQQQLKHIQRDIIDSKAQIEVNSTKISSMLYNEGNLEIAKSEVYNLLEKFQQMKNENELSKFQVKINEGNSQITKIEVEIDEINKKVGAANKQSDLHAKLSLLNESKQEKESSLNQLVSFHKSNFEKEVGEALQVETCDSAIGNKIQKIEQQIKDLTLVIDQEKETYNNSNNSLQSNLGKLGVLEALLSNLRLKIFDVIDEDQLDTYEILINDLESDYRDALDALNTIEVTKQFNIKAIDIAEKEKLCSLCYRPFSSPELTKFVDLLKEKVSKMNAETLTSEFEQSKCDLESAKSIGSDVIQYRKSIEELSQLKQEINSLEPKVSEQKDLYDTYIALFNELKLKSSKLTTLQRPMSDIIRITQEIKNLNTQINDFKESLEDNDTQGGSGHSVSELQSIQQLKNQEIKAIRTMINENLDAKYAKQRELSRFENNIKDKQIAVSDLEKSLLDKKNLITTLENLEIKISKWQDESQQIEFELIEFEEKKAVESLNLTELLLENRKTEGELQEKISTFESILKDFQRLNTSIQKFQTGGLRELRETSLKVESLESSIDSKGKESDKLRMKIKSIEKSISESSNFHSNIRSNLDLRNLEKESEEIIEEIQQLDIADAERKRDEYQEETKRIRNLIIEVNAEHAGKVGEVRQMEDQIKSLRVELDTEFRDIDKVYHEEWVKLQTNVIISNDLQTYSKALDNAIMKYHSIKMEEINRIIDELWKQTYKGPDVDTIAIKSDVNVQAKGNRSYNYRVVMYKMGSELDMRGRCSAGQKVLASIIIRLALAECFGINCGMIALDEPTTNLDIDNIESLAEALNNIIESRKKQKNFQLIVITHDEKFLSHISGDKFTDHFYRVQRDANQKSTIRSLPISLIQEE